MRIRLLRLFLPALLCLSCLLSCVGIAGQPASIDGTYQRVSRVIDGDTIVLADGQHIRFLGIDCPELHPQDRAAECGAVEATDENRRIIGGSRVRLEADITDRDNYGRLLRYVYTESGLFVNYELVRRGWAQVFNVPPNVKYQADFNGAQMLAKNENLGLWKKCYHQ
jgi:micrococcal nuclease